MLRSAGLVTCEGNGHDAGDCLIRQRLPPTSGAGYFSTACLFLLTAIAGFFPRSVEILTGLRRNPPGGPRPRRDHGGMARPAVVQNYLVAQRVRLAQTLGLSSFLLGTAVIGSMVAG